MAARKFPFGGELKRALEDPPDLPHLHNLMARSKLRAAALLILFLVLCPCDSWRQWEYKSVTTDDWKDVWGYEQGPRGRRGHSMSMLGSRLIMFGGRDNEIQRQHVPKTYNIIEVEGSLEFQTYEDYPVSR